MISNTLAQHPKNLGKKKHFQDTNVSKEGNLSRSYYLYLGVIVAYGLCKVRLQIISVQAQCVCF